MRNLWLSFLIFGGITGFATQPAFGQLRLHSLSPVNLAQFESSLNIYNWHYQLGWGASPGKLDFVTHYTLANTMLYRRGQQLWKDQQSADLIIRKSALQNRTFITRFDFNSLQDEFSSFNYDRVQAGMTLASRFEVRSKIIVQPEVGFRMENRSELAETGPYFATLLQAPQLHFLNLSHNLDAWGEKSAFKNRQNSKIRIAYSLAKYIAEGTRDSLNIYYDFLRRDNFLGDPQNNIVESLNKRRFGVSNFLRYAIGEQSGFLMQNDIAMAGIEIDNRRIRRRLSKRGHDDFNIDNKINMYWRAGKFDQQFAFEFGAGTIEYNISDTTTGLVFPQRFAGVGYDISEKYARLSHTSRVQISRKDSLRFNFGLSKLEYDNTDQARSDNHDEQRWQIAFVHTRKFNTFITVRSELSTFLRHFIYLSSQLSGQNNWTRIIKFQPECIVRISPRTEFRQKVGVRANYVVSDFNAANSVINNYVIRDFYSTDSLAIGLTDRLGCVLQYRFELEELGSLNWQKFSARPRTAWQNHWGSIIFRQRYGDVLNLSMGLVFYEQRRWDYKLQTVGKFEKKHAGTHLNLGPTFEASFINRHGSIVLLNAKRQKAFPFLGNPYYINNLELIVQWKF